VSEFTRVKAFGNVRYEEDFGWVCDNAYNIIEVRQREPGSGHFELSFANELKRLPNIIATPLLNDGDTFYDVFLCVVNSRSTTGFTIATYFPSLGSYADGPFYFVVH